ncbi:MAG: H-type lectin domain-containing protein [Rhodobacteraceae bacterium]|nr:H-type lectin domain-containing protein [Paracoccaceae bacterium]
MRRLESHAVGLDQGSLILFSDYQDGGAMWTGDGPRELRRLVEFSEPYLAPPIVHVTLSMWDVDQKHNGRLDLSADMVSEDGFVIVFRTWGDSRVARVRADWLAIGALRGEDDWEVV